MRKIAASNCHCDFLSMAMNTACSGSFIRRCTCSASILQNRSTFLVVMDLDATSFRGCCMAGRFHCLQDCWRLLLALSGALLVGAISGLYGGFTDDALMRLAEVAVAVPSFYLLLAVRSLLPLRTGPVVAFLLVVCIIGFLSWARPARLVRGVVLSGRERNFVLAARGFGASRIYLLRRHLMPMTFPVMITQMVVLVPQFILAEVVLSFLGLGISEPFPSWGNMLAYAQQYHILSLTAGCSRRDLCSCQ